MKMTTDEILAHPKREMSVVLVDSNDILDVVTSGPRWCQRSSKALEEAANESALASTL